MTELIVFLIVSLITAAAVVLHGGNWLPRGYIMAGHCLIVTVCLVFLKVSNPFFLAVTVPVCLFFWYCFRNTPLVRAEQNAMQRPDSKNLSRVLWNSVVVTAIAVAGSATAFICAGDYFGLIPCAATMIAAPASYFGIKRIFNKETDFGIKEDARLDHELEIRRIEAARSGLPPESVNADRFFTLRNYIELTAGLFPSGIGTATLILAAGAYL